jgi:hypothetical protein
MAQVVQLVRQDGPSDEECKRFLWCLGQRLEVGARSDVPDPTPEDLEKIEPLAIADFTVDAEDLEAGRAILLDAATWCVHNPFGIYAFPSD